MAKWAMYDEEDEPVINETDIEALAWTSDFDWFQNECQKTAIYPKQQGLAYTALGLVSEAGEYAGKIKKGIRDGTFDDVGAAAELGDVLWYVATAAHELGYTMDEIAHGVIKKLRDRQQRNVIKGSGDNR
jgi:NTP pyrophosphatase (non-canonical NTP hydrolase)